MGNTLPGISPIPKPQFFTNGGLPAAGYHVYFAQPGTTAGPGSVTPKNTYTDITAATPNTNPVVLDAYGRASIWLLGYYSVAVYDAATPTPALVYTQDNVSASGADVSGTSINYFDATAGNVSKDLKGTTDYQAFKVDNSANTVTLIDTTGGNTFFGGLSSYVLTAPGQYVHLVLHGGVWYVENTNLSPVSMNVISGALVSDGIWGGNITYKDAATVTISPTSCMDSTNKIPLYINSPTDLGFAGLAANTVYQIAITRLLAGSFAYKYYLTEAAMAADGTINAYRWLGARKSTPTSTMPSANQYGDEMWYDRLSENPIMSLTAAPANITTPVDLTSFLPVTRVCQVLPGGKHGAGGNGSQRVGVSGVSGTAQTFINVAAGYEDGAGDYFEWGQSGTFIPLSSQYLYWGRGTDAVSGTVQLAIHAVRFRR